MNDKNRKYNKKLNGGSNKNIIYILLFIVLLIFGLILYNMYNTNNLNSNSINNNNVDNTNVDNIQNTLLNNYLINILKYNKITDLEELNIIKEKINVTEVNKLEIFAVGNILYQYLGEIKLN